jgi:hypothetical protein
MMQASPAPPSPASRPPAIQFYSVEISPLADGRMSAGIGATICETVDDDDLELVNMDVAFARVDTIDEALAVIRQAVASTMPN